MSSQPAVSLASEEAICRKHIEAMVEASFEINGAVVSTTDGFEVAAHLDNNQSAAKLSAMTSSLIALAQAISGESHIGTCNDILIEASTGRLLLMEIPRADRPLLLAVLCDRDSTMGQVLWTVRRCRDEIVSSLNAT